MAIQMKFSLKPLGDRVILKPVDTAGEKKLSSGIIIPDSADKEKPMQGTVVAVGEGRIEDGKRVPMQVKVGDKVLFGKYSHEEIKQGGEAYYILSESNILAVIK